MIRASHCKKRAKSGQVRVRHQLITGPDPPSLTRDAVRISAGFGSTVGQHANLVGEFDNGTPGPDRYKPSYPQPRPWEIPPARMEPARTKDLERTMSTANMHATHRKSKGKVRLSPIERVETPATLYAVLASKQDERSLENVRQSLEVEQAAKRRLVLLRRDLERARSEASLSEVRDRNRAAVIEAKAKMEYLRGAHLKGVVTKVKPASVTEMTSLALQIVEFMERTEVDPANRGWFVLFKRMDADENGRITYAELIEYLRKSMGFDEETLPEVKVQAVWNAIDLDGNGWMDTGEFGRFFRMGEQAHAPMIAERRRKKLLAEARDRADEARRLAEQAGDVEAIRATASAMRLTNQARHIEHSLSEPRLAKSRGSLATLDVKSSPTRASTVRGSALSPGLSATSLPPIT